MEFCKPASYVKDHHTVTEYVYDKLYDYSELKAFMCDIEKAYGILDLISCKKMESGKDTWNKQFQSVDDFLNNFTIEDYNKSNMYYMKSDEENFEFFINDIEKNFVVMKDLDKINIQRNEKEKYYIYEDKYVVRRNIYDEFFKKMTMEVGSLFRDCLIHIMIWVHSLKSLKKKQKISIVIGVFVKKAMKRFFWGMIFLTRRNYFR